MNREETDLLTRAMSDLGAAEKAIAPPAVLESVLLAEFDRSTRSRRQRRLFSAAAGAIAAAVVCIALLWSPAPQARARPAQLAVKVIPAIRTAPAPPAQQPARKPLIRCTRATDPSACALPQRARAAEPAPDSNPFVAIPYTLPLDPHERVTVMRVEMPVAALVSVGLAWPSSDPAATTPADAIVSQDGRIRALRLLSAESSASSSTGRVNR